MRNWPDPDGGFGGMIMIETTALHVLRSGLLALALLFAPAARAQDLEAFARATFARDATKVEFTTRSIDGAQIVEARADGRGRGWAFSTWSVIHSVGYSGQPVDIEVALDAKMTIAAARLVRQSEPILIIGISPEQLREFVAGLTGLDVLSLSRTTALSSARRADALAGATVSSGVFRDAVVRSARIVARGVGALAVSGAILREKFEPSDWSGLIASKAIASRRVDAGEFAIAVGARTPEPDLLLIEAFAALATPAGVGQNLLGKHIYDSLIATIGPDDNLLFVGANGLLSFKGSDWRSTGVFDRLTLLQGDRTIRLTREMYRDLDQLAPPDAPELRERALFILPSSSGFDPAKPFRLSILLSRVDADRATQAAPFDLDYHLPGSYIAPPPIVNDPALWMDIWRARLPEIVALLSLLATLFAILLFQDTLVEHLKLYRRTRIGFLAVTLLFLGLYSKAQLSVVHVVTFIHALRTDFKWELFLLDPLIFILWGFVAMAMLFWGRGVFCGWLCPFGALQELLNEAARRLGIKQWEPPWALHERLGMIKYLVFLAIFAISLNSMDWAFRAAEVEPFKTVVALHFMRAAPFVLFAGATLAAGLFVRRFYCRYLCPLGGALALPARLRTFEWLKRRPQCGKECRQCAVQCPVKAINPSGVISPNECIYCLNCQAMYHDPKVCKGLEGREARRVAMEAMLAARKDSGNV